MSTKKQHDDETTEQSDDRSGAVQGSTSLGQDYTQDHKDPVDNGTVSDPGNSGAVTPAAEQNDDDKKE